jgi:xanthine dehydrogenase small subunit
MKEISSNFIQWYLDDDYLEIPIENHQETLLDFIRLKQGNSSIKEGCAEGDCGACMVLVGQMKDDKLVYQATNSCIKFTATCHKKVVYTAKYLSKNLSNLHPVQKALVDCHSSQCGFCTPGFVISLLAAYLNEHKDYLTQEEVIEAISGNLCRCTGYRPIIEAGLVMKQIKTPHHFNLEGAFSSHKIRQQNVLATLDNLSNDSFIAPKDLKTFATIYYEHPDYQILAGGTDVGLWVTQHLVQLKPILYLGEVKELQDFL